MKLSTKCRYGSRAVMEVARNYKSGPVKRKDIVKNQQISDSYLENILIALKNSGIIETIRGAKGGYLLRRPASEITLLEIVNSLDGSLSPVECLETPSICERTEWCATRVAWIKMREAQEEVLRNISIQKLIDSEKQSFVADYCI